MTLHITQQPLSPSPSAHSSSGSTVSATTHSKRSPVFDDVEPMTPYIPHINESRLHRFIDTFKRDPNSTFVPSDHGLEAGRQPPRRQGPYYDLHMAALESAHGGGLMRSLKGRHLQMIAMGGSIGACSPKFGTMWLSC